MADRHKTNPLTFRPPPELRAWAESEHERRGVPLSQVLNEALEHERERLGGETEAAVAEGR